MKSLTERYCELLAGATASFATASLGCSIAWPTSVLPKLTSPSPKDNPLGATLLHHDARMWIDTAPAIGGIVGPLVACWMADRKGRRIALLFSTALYVVSWMLFLLVASVEQLIVARATCGFANGYVLLAATLYIAEIASDRYRDMLGCFLQIGTTFGILYVYCLGPYVNFQIVHALCCAQSILFCVLFVYMPETPAYLISRGRYRQAIESLLFLRGSNHDSEVRDELDELVRYTVRPSCKTSYYYQDSVLQRVTKQLLMLFTDRTNGKALLISLGLVVCQQWTYIDGILGSCTQFFAKATTTIRPEHATIILGGVQFFFSCLSPLILGRFARRSILMFAAIGMALAFVTLAIYFQLRKAGVLPHDTLSFHWIPLIAALAFVALYNGGFGPAAWALVMELFAHQVKPLGLSFSVSCLLLCDFVVLRLFSFVTDSVGLEWAFWMLAVACTLAFGFSCLCVIETRGLTLCVIQERLGGTNKVLSTR
ncbi:facilitated trehalose transporter Tret1-like [Anopheles aquasalis]|uniref:facilitated trehalose transporter Tret1-like n=1 Tax=Anopheles aquasalis TaxID=42839 RepID=UPI00215B64F7|nr:facilitated trehalose transporter Tret1-like [Anopheles aquasalis]